MLKDILQRMNTTLLTPPYNLIVHSAPLHDEAGRERVLSLARRGDAEAHARRRLRVGDRVLHQSDGTGRSGGGAAEDEDREVPSCEARSAKAGHLALSSIRVVL